MTDTRTPNSAAMDELIDDPQELEYPGGRRINALEKAEFFARAQRTYQSLWSGFIIEDDEQLQHAKDEQLPHTRPMAERAVREMVRLSGRKLSDLRNDTTRSEAEMDAELRQLGDSRMPLEIASLHYIAGWQHIGQIYRHLAAQGQPLDKQALSRPYGQAGRSYLQQAATLRRMPEAVAHLNEHGEQLTAEDLLQTDGSASPLLQSCIDAGSVTGLFQRSNWIGQSTEALRRVYHALPEAQRAQVPNYHSLLTAVQTQEQAKGIKGR